MNINEVRDNYYFEFLRIPISFLKVEQNRYKTKSHSKRRQYDDYTYDTKK